MSEILPYVAFVVYVGIMALLLLRNVKILTTHERLVVFRMGQYYRAIGPGLVFLVPIIDRGRIINLDGVIPGWKGMSKLECEDAIHKYVGDNLDFLMK